MDVVIARLRREGHSIEDIAGMTGYSVDQVHLELEKHKKSARN